MSFVVCFVVLCVSFVGGHEPEVVQTKPGQVDDGLASSELVNVIVVFRHGDRTPDLEELELYPSDKLPPNLFFPYGMKALTNRGKQRGFLVGKYLRMMYDKFVSRLYLQDEISIRTTDFDRTKMTALTALAAMYPPQPAQRWNVNLNWQPIPYFTPPKDEDDMLYYYNCPRYIWLRNSLYTRPQMSEVLKPYQSLYKLLSERTGNNITTPEDVFYLDNLFQTLINVGLPTPSWALEVMPQIKEMTKIEYALEFYNAELVRLASGVLFGDWINKTKEIVNGGEVEPKLYLVSAHENNVAGVMAAARVFYPHQPSYGATFSLELRRRKASKQYGVAAIYSPIAGGPGKVLPIKGCGGQLLCDYETFLNLTQNVIITMDEYKEQCSNVPEGHKN